MSRFVALLTVAFALIAVMAHAADSALSDKANAAFLATYEQKTGVVTRPSGLRYSILRSGYGKRPAATDVVTVYYTGSLINGTVFDATEAGFPATFTVNQLIPGWTEALELMREGDHWQVVIPSELAYGARGAGEGKIPPNQVLVFDLELIKVSPPPKDEKDQNGSPQ